MGRIIEHTLPQAGEVHLTLYAPADSIYERLLKNKEVARLQKLRHLGTISFAFTGARLARWDYTAALLYYSSKFTIPKFNSKFKIGEAKLSSSIAALQSASLLWNIGHLPGTFATEKGLFRRMIENNSKNPCSFLPWKFKANEKVSIIIDKCNELLIHDDYQALSKVLSVYKALSFCNDEDDWLFHLVTDFYAPLILGFESYFSKQWSKLRRSFRLVRHLSYLTLDLPFSGIRWAPNIPDFFDHQLNLCNGNLNLLATNISESLSPLERQVFDVIYHSNRAMENASICAQRVYDAIPNKNEMNTKTNNWIKKGLFRDLSLGKLVKVNRCLSFRVRSHFAPLPDSPSNIEKELQNKGFTHPVVFKYEAWNSEALFEPDEVVIDLLSITSPSSTDVGKIAYWFCNKFDDLVCEKDDTYSLMKKVEIEPTYKELLCRAIGMNFQEITAQIEPWNLERFGIVNDIDIPDGSGGIWAANAKMNDKLCKHLMRNRIRSIDPSLKEEYSELRGLAELRAVLRKEMRGKNPKCRWLLVTASLIFEKENKPIIEFDGGILKISPISGKLTWYGLETKSGKENPVTSLRRRLSALGMHSVINSISKKHAYCEIQLG